MTPVQGEPPKIDFRLPKKLKAFLNAMRTFVIQTQPIDGPGVKLSQYPRGRLLSVDEVAISAAAAEASHPFKIVGVTDTSFKVIGGTAAGYSISTTADITGVTTTRYVVIEVTRTSGYDADTGVWSASAASISSQTGSYLSATTSRQIIQVGVVTCSGGVITSISQVVSGNQWAARTGNGTTYVDANGLV